MNTIILRSSLNESISIFLKEVYMMTDKHSLFTISEAAHACGVSRSTILRMEDKGLLKPAYISPESKRRYYDPYNISRILHIQKFQEMGFSKDEIGAYFSSQGDAKPLLFSLEERLRYLQQFIEELEIRALNKPNLFVEVTTLPEVVCRVHKTTGLTPEEKTVETYNFYRKCVSEGCVLTAEPLFIINERTDYLEGKLTNEPYPYYACVPVDPKHAPATTKRFPACKALSVFYYGEYKNLNTAWLKLGEEVRRRGLTPIDYPRGIAIVAPYTGREIHPQRHCGKVVVPISMR